MRGFRRGRIVASNSEVKALGEWRDTAPLSPADLFARLGMVMLVALGFGLAARLLFGAPL